MWSFPSEFAPSPRALAKMEQRCGKVGQYYAHGRNFATIARARRAFRTKFARAPGEGPKLAAFHFGFLHRLMIATDARRVTLIPFASKIRSVAKPPGRGST